MSDSQPSTLNSQLSIINGRILPASDAAISVADAGFVHGAAVAEMIRTFRHEPFRVDDHLKRLQTGITALGIDYPPKQRDLTKAIHEVVSHNAGTMPLDHDLGIIVFVTAGMNRTYLGAAFESAPHCTWGVHTFPLPFELWADKMQHGQHLVIPPQIAVPPESLDPQIKWRSRVHWFLADRAARRINPQATALLQDQRGYLTETSAANLFLVKNGGLFTPRAESTLNGISRQVVFELAKKLRIDCDYADLTVDDVFAAQEVFTSSTPYCLMPVATLNNRPVGGKIPGLIYERLMAAWNDSTGMNIIEQICGRSTTETRSHEEQIL